MTIAISLKVNDGLVLAADSASTILGDSPMGQHAVKVYNNANKIFNLYKGLPIGAVTWGLGSIGDASISTLVKDLRKLFNDPTSEWYVSEESYMVKDVADKVYRYLKEKHDAVFATWTTQPRPQLGFIVAGYSRGADKVAEEYQFTIGAEVDAELHLLRARDQAGITWNGVIEPISRLVLGFSPFLPNIIQNSLGLSQDQMTAAMGQVQQALQAPLVLPPMPLQDAIELAEFLVDLTIDYSRFAPGAAVVGGPKEVAAISKHEGFKWIHRKHYYRRDLNPEGEAYG